MHIALGVSLRESAPKNLGSADADSGQESTTSPFVADGEVR